MFTQRLRTGADEEEALVDGVFLNEESLTQITRLFKVCTLTFTLSYAGEVYILLIILKRAAVFHGSDQYEVV